MAIFPSRIERDIFRQQEQHWLCSQASHLPLHAGRRPCDVWDSAGVSLWLCPGRRNAPCQRCTADNFVRSNHKWPPAMTLMAYCRRCFPFPAGRVKYSCCWYEIFKVQRREEKSPSLVKGKKMMILPNHFFEKFHFIILF